MTRIPDKLLINLKIISKIQKNGRITRSHSGIIYLEYDTFYQPVKRFINGDSRRQSVFEINSIIDECIEKVNLLIMSTTNYQQIEIIKLIGEELENAKEGIQNLKFTYGEDANVTSHLDTVLIKVDTCLKEINTFLQNDVE